MDKETKAAIQSAEQDLEKDKREALKKQIYDYLKGELDSIERIETQMRKLNEQKKAHNENIKNLKQGNLKAIEERTKSFGWNGTITSQTTAQSIGAGIATGYASVIPAIYTATLGGTQTTSIYNLAASQQALGNTTGYAFYANYVAGQTISSSSGKTSVF